METLLMRELSDSLQMANPILQSSQMELQNMKQAIMNLETIQ